MKTKNQIKYYIYLRKSSEGEDRQVQSIERQAEEVNKLVVSQGLIIAGTFEESRSAMTPNNRPAFTKMIKGIKAGKADGIVCWHINRLARNPLESGIVQQLLEDNKIQLIVTKDREYSSADNAIIFSVESSLATQYSKDLGKMVKSGMEKKANMGIAPIKAPLGYLNTKMAEHGSNYIIKDPERFDIVRKMWEMVLSKQYSIPAIIKVITSETGFTQRPGRDGICRSITRSGLYESLTNPFYTGLFKYKGVLYKGKHDAMVTTEEFETVQRILGRTQNASYQKHELGYRGIMTCGNCGSAITASVKSKHIKSTDLFNTYVYYYCTQRKGTEKCAVRQILKQDELEELIKNEISQVSISENFQIVAHKVIAENKNSLYEQEENIRALQEKEITHLKKQVRNLLQLRLNNLINDTEFQTEKNKREEAIVFIEQKIKEGYGSPTNRLNELKTGIEKITTLTEKFASGTETERKNLLLMLGENHHLTGKKLSINKPFWLQCVEKYKKEIEQEILMFEPEKYIDNKYFSVHFKDLFPGMSALVDEVGTNNRLTDL